jgi:hypothetical protein
MSDTDEPKKSATETLAALVAQRKAASSGAPGPGGQGRKQTERAAAAKAASKSRPAMRKT